MGSATFEGFHAFSAHADLVTISTGCRSNFIFDANLVDGALPLSFNKTTATSYELRNYDGDVIKSGALVAGAAPTITDEDLTWRGRGPYGWYRLYLFGESVANWGTAYGDMTFYRVSDSDLFADNPSSATAAVGRNGIDEIARGVMGLGPARVNASISVITPWKDAIRASVSGTSVTVAPGSLGNGSAVKLLLFHSFIGDPSELATPTQSGNAVTWTMERRATSGNVTATVWSGLWSSTINPGTITVSSGAETGTHTLYTLVVQDGSWSFTRTNVSTTGTGTTASVTCPVQGTFPAGRQKGIFGFVALDGVATVTDWSGNLTTTGWDRNNPGDLPLAPNTLMSVATDVLPGDTEEEITVTWDTSRDYVLIGVSLCPGPSSLPTASVAQSKQYWADYALPSRPRKPIVLFADGINERIGLVAPMMEAFGPDVAFSPFNEPIYSLSQADYVNYELAPFYAAAKAADPDCTVLGGSNVAFTNDGGGLPAIATSIAAGLLDHCDDFDVHPYNCFNGDISLTRDRLGALVALLEDNNFTGNMWQTEQGFPWQHRGQTWPRYAGRWTALMFLMCELYGITVERNFYWYDIQHGFDSFPTWWVGSNGPGPQALPVRTMVDEIGNRTLSAQLDFGDAVNMYAGGTWAGDDGSKTVGFVAQSLGQPPVRFATSMATVVVVDCWGNAVTYETSGGYLTLPASEMPTWIRVPAGSTLALVPADWDWGTNHALNQAPSSSFDGSILIYRVTGGTWYNQYRNGTSSLTNTDAPYNSADSPPELPATITVPLAELSEVGRVVVACPAPWQALTALIDFDIEYQNADDSWTVGHTFSPPASTSFPFISVGRCRSETFWSQKSSFVWAPATPVNAKGVRVKVRSYSDGPHESSVWTNNGNITTTPKLMVSEIEAWSTPAVVLEESDPAPEPFDPDRPRFLLTVTCSG